MRQPIRSSLIISLILPVFLMGCKKDNTETPPSPQSEAIINCHISMKGDTIMKVEEYRGSDTLLRILYTFYDDTVKVDSRRIAINGYKSSSQEIYFLNSQGLAVGSVFIPSTDAFVDSFTSFKYVDGYLVEANGTRYYKSSVDSVFRKFKVDSNNNIVEELTPLSCANQFSFNQLPNMIDIRYFQNEFLGRISANLIDSLYFPHNCICGGSQTVQMYYKFSYKLDNQNRVSQMTQFYIPCQHGGEKPDTVSIERHFTYIQL